MVVLADISAALPPLTPSPPGASWLDALFGYGALALLIVLVVRQEMNAENPPVQE